MKRLAGLATVYALIAALALVAPLSADEVPTEVVPIETAPPEPALTEPTPTEPTPTEPAASPEPVPPEPEQAPPTDPAPAPSDPAPSPAPFERVAAEREAAPPRATAAADTTVTISDFQFAPSSVTVDVGDTVTWRNEGPTPHSATAGDGSFDTGTYKAGQSRSHTFNEAGTFNYFCTPHPQMRGTVTVRAASRGGGGGDAGGGGGSGTDIGAESGTGAGSDSGSDSGDGSGTALPATGLDAGGLAVLGFVTLALGAWLRRRSASAAG